MTDHGEAVGGTAPHDDLLDQIRSRGHWHFVVRPVEFDADRVAYEQLEGLVDRSRVSVRGWDLPHVRDPDPIERGAHWVGRHSAFDYNREIWRVHQSGQFVHIKGVRQDWRDHSELRPAGEDWQPGTRLGVSDCLYTLGEYYEFAKRYALNLPGGDAIVVRLQLFGLAGRELYVDDPNRAPFFEPYTTGMASFDFGRQVFRRPDLIAEPRDHAVSAAEQLFVRFGWTPDQGLLRGVLDQIWPE